jgi:hypothetical protein
MVSNCRFVADGNRVQCQDCGFSLCNAKLPVHRACPAAPTPRPGLGDMVAAWLSAIGITKERVSAVVGGDCGCAKRQEALNELGRRVGIG